MSESTNMLRELNVDVAAGGVQKTCVTEAGEVQESQADVVAEDEQSVCADEAVQELCGAAAQSMLAVSRAGHDRDTVYVVVDSDPEYVWLVDGRRRLLANPKKKKRKHVQIIRHLPDGLAEQIQAVTLDAHVRKIISAYAGNRK